MRGPFRSKSGHAVPRRANWDDAPFRQWIMWNYERRTEVWDLNNRVTRAAGGLDCIWSGMNSGSVSAQARSFRDLKEISRRANILLLDHQRRDNATGFQQNGDIGKRVHALIGWDKLAPESMAMYENSRTNFRVASKPAAEARMWMISGIAGGIQPWWHHVGAYAEDRRMYRIAEPVMKWHKANEGYLLNRQPIASVGLVWSQRSTDFYGRDNAADLVDAPYEGFAQALIRARIPYLPIHVDDIDQQAAGFSVLVLANVGGVSDEQCAAIRRLVARGVSLIATGESSVYNEWGDPRPDLALADLLRVHMRTKPVWRRASPSSLQTYLRLHPEFRARVYGPRTGKEPSVSEKRHPALEGFDETDLIPFGGRLLPIQIDEGAIIPLTFVPEFPTLPPETAWMRESDTTIPGLVVSETPSGSRVAYLAADLDRRYMRELLPDHGNLLANLVRWANRDPIPLHVQGAGLVDCHLYRQQNKLILHIVNLTNSGTWRAPIDELVPIGPLRVAIKLPPGVRPHNASLAVAAATLPVKTNQGWVEFAVKSIRDHEMVVIS
jgi:hypothetical protein